MESPQFVVKRARRNSVRYLDCVTPVPQSSSSSSGSSNRAGVLNGDSTTRQKGETPKELRKVSVVLEKPVIVKEASSSSPVSQDKCKDLRKKYDDFGNSLFQEWQESQEKHKAEREEFEKEKAQFAKDQKKFAKKMQVVEFLEDEILEKKINKMPLQTIKEEMKDMKEKRDLWDSMKRFFRNENNN